MNYLKSMHFQSHFKVEQAMLYLGRFLILWSPSCILRLFFFL